MPRGERSKYTDKQIPKAEATEASYKRRGVPANETASLAWATVNGNSCLGDGLQHPHPHPFRQEALVATEYDLASNVATASLTFTYDNVPPVLTIGLNNDTGVSKTDKDTSDPTLIGTASSGATLKFSEGSTALGSTTANTSGSWVYDPTGSAKGPRPSRPPRPIWRALSKL